MAVITPNPRTWTMRFKHHRTTLLLHCDPVQRISAVKAELLKALQQTNPDGTFQGQNIPRNSEEIVLAKPVDKNDLTLGWRTIDRSEAVNLDDEPLTGKGKGKVGAVGAAKGRANGMGSSNDTLQGAGLRDGGIVAFKFKSELEVTKGQSEDDDNVLLGWKLEEQRWDVVMPTYEETYAEEDGMAAVER